MAGLSSNPEHCSGHRQDPLVLPRTSCPAQHHSQVHGPVGLSPEKPAGLPDSTRGGSPNGSPGARALGLSPYIAIHSASCHPNPILPPPLYFMQEGIHPDCLGQENTNVNVQATYIKCHYRHSYSQYSLSSELLILLTVKLLKLIYPCSIINVVVCLKLLGWPKLIPLKPELAPAPGELPWPIFSH